MTECIALIRGINVGRGKRISMADLRQLHVRLGHQNVRTLLNSGNVLFDCERPKAAELSLAIQNGILKTFGFSAGVVVITAASLAAIVRENPLLKIAVDPARHLVAFVGQPRLLTPLRPMMKEPWAPDVLAIGSRAAYLWCQEGLIASRLSQTFGRRAGDTVTTRNWSTVLKLLAASK
jgi:uncharacterized protein (DUF1697 family)